MYVYRNLKTRRWTVADKPQASKAWPQVDSVTIQNVTFRESTKSWARGLRQALDKTSKYSWDVHAFAIGEVVAAAPEGAGIPCTYDKWGCGHFIRKDTGAPITACDYLEFCADGSVVAKGAVQ